MTDLSQYTLRKQAETLNEQLPTIILGTVGVGSVIMLTMLFVFDALPLLIWLAYMLLIGALRWYGMLVYRKEGFDKRGVQFWLNVFLSKDKERFPQGVVFKS